MSRPAPDLYQRMRAYLAEHGRPQVTFGTVAPDPQPAASQMSLARARVETGDKPPFSLSTCGNTAKIPSDVWDARRRRSVIDRARWCDLSSTLFWLARRGWPSLEVGGETIAGETAWRRWVSRAGTVELLAVRDRVAP